MLSVRLPLRTSRFTLPIFFLLSLYGCGGSDDKPSVEPPPPPVVTKPIDGGGVKGPMANATVNAYVINPSASDFKGSLVATGRTNDSAQIVDLDLPEPFTAPYLIEIIANSGTTDITTGQFPIITTMSTIVTDDALQANQAIYATPMSTMAVALTIVTADSNTAPFVGNGDGQISTAEVLATMPVASELLKSTLGFGIGDNVDLFATPPLINSATDTKDEQAATAAYRSAIEAISAVVFQIKALQGDAAVDTDTIMLALARDLADGTIDGMEGDVVSSAYPLEALDVLAQDPATLPIPNDPQGRTVADVKAIVVAETTTTGTSTDTTEYAQSNEQVSLEKAETSPDIDGDGVLNAQDAFPEDASADTDTDHDGLANTVYELANGQRTGVIDELASDPDDDNDGVLDTVDAFPLNNAEWIDTDNDGIGNNADPDDDNDTVNDVEDDFPLDATRSNATDQDNDTWPDGQDPNDNDASIPGIAFVDTDNDGLANDGGLAPDNDDDNDGVTDDLDAFPLDKTESADLDNDGIGNNSDPDIDGDGVANALDAFPRNANEQIDTDKDGIGNNADLDDDGDSLTDAVELQIGTDPLKADTDGDGVFDNKDALPLDPNERFDNDKDGVGNNSDNCPLAYNPLQLNSDDDAFGDACDLDDDNDGVPDTEDAFPLDPTRSVTTDADQDGWPTDQDPNDNNASIPGFPYVDTDLDGIGDFTDPDDDNDGVPDENDRFPLDPKESVDTDNDGIGNNADPDDDNDGVADIADKFPLDATESKDFDNDGIGDNADPDDDNDGVNDNLDAFPFDSTESTDTDGDGVGNNSDADDDNDGVVDGDDAFPLDKNESVDTDGDGIGNNADPDDDNDGVNDTNDAFPLEKNEWLDTDGDGVGNNADPDDDNDGVNDANDAFPLDKNEWLDTDGDGVGNNADPDDDNDGVADADDAFPLDKNEWLDTDGDGVGNNADPDDDNDGVADADDAFPLDKDESVDTDGDGIGNNADPDDDNDGVADADDAFPLDKDEWLDTDSDGVGNNADPDDDNDGVNDADDAFPLDKDEWLDTDGDGIGNNADPDDDNDGVADTDDAFPLDKDESVDTDGDGIGNNADPDDDNDGVADDHDVAPLDDTVRFGGVADVVTFGGLYHIEDSREFDLENSLGYTELNHDVFQQHTALNRWMYNQQGFSFELINQVANDLVLTSNGWQNETEDYQIMAFNSDGSFDVSNSQNHQLRIAGDIIAINGLSLIANDADGGYLDWQQYLDADSTFPADSQLVHAQIHALTDSVYLHQWHDCAADQQYGGLCNHVELQPSHDWQDKIVAEQLEQLMFDKELPPIENGALPGVRVAGFEGKQLIAQLINSPESHGQAVLYWQSFSASGQSTAKRLATAAQWEQRSEYGVALLVVHLPPQVQQAIGPQYHIDDFHRVFVVHQGYVREGSLDAAGDAPEQMRWFNHTAMQALLANLNVTDFDQDGLLDHADPDDDNDGVADDADAFPKDPTETEDSDHDGIGNNADNDDDNDGVTDTDDLEPINPNVGAPLSFTTSELGSHYFEYGDGVLNEPSINTAQLNGDAIIFTSSDRGAGENRYGTFGFSYVISDNRLSLTLDNPAPETSWYNVHQLREYGLIDDEQAQQFIAKHGNMMVQVQRNKLGEQWQLLSKDAAADRFYVHNLWQMYISDAWIRTELYGDDGLHEVTSDRDHYTQLWRHYDALPSSNWNGADVVGEWAMPAALFADNDALVMGFDMFTFNNDGSGQSQFSARSFSWQVDGANIIINYDDGAITTVTLRIAYQDSFAVEGHSTVNDQQFSIFGLAIKRQANTDPTPVYNQMLMSSFSLTNPAAYQQQQLQPGNWFGFRLEDSGFGVKINGQPDFRELDRGWSPVQWQWRDNALTIVQNWNHQQYAAPCDSQQPTCEPFRKRHWLPLKLTADRLYVMEWEEINYNAQQQGVEPQWQLYIPARAHFYQVVDFDSDQDGIVDNQDPDDDNDGVADSDDDMPFDPWEQLDSDHDGIGNNADPDDDNDGIADGDDRFPTDPNEWADADNDGLGDNSDSDDDNDGVNDEDDLAPRNPSIGLPLAFDSSQLGQYYLQRVLGRLTDPLLAMNAVQGQYYQFNSDGSGSVADKRAQHSYNWTLANNWLTLNFSQALQGTTYVYLSQLPELGLADESAVQSIIASYGDYQTQLNTEVQQEQWALAQVDGVNQQFYIRATTSYFIVDDWLRETLWGSKDATARIGESEDNLRLVNNVAELTLIPFTAEQLVGQFAFSNRLLGDEPQLVADIAGLQSDGTGALNFANQNLDWQINNGQLLIQLASGELLQVSQYQTFDGSSEVHVLATTANGLRSTYELWVPLQANAELQSSVGQFLMSSFTLTNPQAWQSNGEVHSSQVFGYRLEQGQRATRIMSSHPDFNQYHNGWDVWGWQVNAANTTILTAKYSQQDGRYSECVVNDNDCKAWRQRQWQPLAKIGGRYFVLEWEDQNSNAFDSQYQAPNWYSSIAPRVNFYETYELMLDTDGDGITDNSDDDDDNDGVLDQDDVFPLDKMDWSDADQDGIGDNRDWDDDNDGVADQNDAFPFDSSEWLDSDGDGIGNNADPDDDNDGVNDDIDLSPLDNRVGQAVSLVDTQIAASYLNIIDGRLNDPQFRLGLGQANRYLFNSDGSGQLSSDQADSTLSWQVTDNLLTVTHNNSPSSASFIRVSQLAKMGLVDETVAQQFIAANGDYQIQLSVQPQQESWALTHENEPGRYGQQDRFWAITESSYFINNDWEREQLWGSINATALTHTEPGRLLSLTEQDSIATSPFQAAELVGRWALTANISSRMTADVVDFAADFTATSELTAQSLTWLVDNGSLVVNYPNHQVRLTRFMQHDNSHEVFVETTNNGAHYTSLELALTLDNVLDYSPLQDQFLMSSFSITNPDVFDDQQTIAAGAVFGYRLQSTGIAQRVYYGFPDFNKPNQGWDNWQWQQDDQQRIVLSAFTEQQAGRFQLCDVSQPNCNPLRTRIWLPLKVVQNRLYVIESEEINDNDWNFDGSPPQWRQNIAPRLSFYEVFDLNQVHP